MVKGKVRGTSYSSLIGKKCHGEVRGETSAFTGRERLMPPHEPNRESEEQVAKKSKKKRKGIYIYVLCNIYVEQRDRDSGETSSDSPFSTYSSQSRSLNPVN